MVLKIYDGQTEAKEGFHGQIIRLNADLTSDLKWDIGVNAPVLWELDFGLNDLSHALNDPIPFQSYKLAIQHFIDTVYLPHKELSLGVILYRGKSDLRSNFKWNALFKEQFEGSFDNPLEVKLFMLDMLADYLHGLGASLPDELPAYALFDVTGVSSAEAAQLMSGERFSHLQLATKGNVVPLASLGWETGVSRLGYIGKSSFFEAVKETHLGLALPVDALITEEVRLMIDELLEKWPLRVVPERLMTENWGELDAIIAIEGAISPYGERMLMGFEAAGGKKMIYSKKNFGVEGFEPPTYCSQSSRASQAALYPDCL